CQLQPGTCLEMNGVRRRQIISNQRDASVQNEPPPAGPLQQGCNEFLVEGLRRMDQRLVQEAMVAEPFRRPAMQLSDVLSVEAAQPVREKFGHQGVIS